MFFSKSNNKLNTKNITTQKLVLSPLKRSKFLLLFEINLMLALILALCYSVFYYWYDADLDLIVNNLCKKVASDQIVTIEKLQNKLAKTELSYQVELSTREQLEAEIKVISEKLKEAQLELDFVRGNNPN